MSLINIVYQCSDSYAKIAGISIMSLLDNNIHINNLNIYIIDIGISEENKKHLTQIGLMYNRNIKFLYSEKYIKLLKDYGLKPYHGSYGMYLKFFIDEMVDEINRVIYIDCDTIICSSIEKLSNIDLGGKAMGMAIDCMNSHMKKGLKLDKNQNYYNTGVIVFDLKKWKENCKFKFTEFVKNCNINYAFVEQDMINICMNSQIQKISLCYNCISLYEKLSYENVCNIYNLNTQNFYTKEEYEEGVNDKVIIHFPSVFVDRPWFEECISGWKDEFDKYYYGTDNPWKNEMKTKSEKTLLVQLQQKMYIYLPRKIYVLLAHLASEINTYKLNKEYRS